MSELANEVIAAARLERGSPFRHHFKPQNLCESGYVTLDSCMDRGMDSRGYDCMGLVIASICKVIGINTHKWPTEYRHSLQLRQFANYRDPQYGDVLFIESVSKTGKPYMTHMGFYIEEGDRILHANGMTKIVDESEAGGNTISVKSVSVESLISHISLGDT